MNKRSWVAAVGGLWVCAVLAMGQAPQGGLVTEFSAATITRPTPANAVELMLAKPVESVDWVESTFEEVLDWLREQGDRKVNVIPRIKHLQAEGVVLDTPVTLTLRDTTVADVLSEALLQVADAGQLTFHGMGNKLIISSRADFDSRLETRVYDVTDLLMRVPDFGETAPAIDLQQTQQTTGGGGGQSVFQGGSSGQEQSQGGEQAEQEIEERLEKFRELIEQSIDPTSWDLTGSQSAALPGAGGGTGRIRVFGRSLVITNTIEVHEKIAGRFGFSHR